MAAARQPCRLFLLLWMPAGGIQCLFGLFCWMAASSVCGGEIICQCTNSSCMLEAELTLSTPVFKSGTNLTATCRLISARGQHCNFTANDIFFRYIGQRFDKPYVTVLDENTALVTIPDLQRVYSGAHMFCHVEGYINRLSSGAEVPMNVGQEVITIADRPERPRFTGCVVYNWLSMNCTWEPAKQDTGIRTDQTLYWTILRDSGVVEYCPILHDGCCIWPSVEDTTHSVQPYRRDFLYYLTITANNTFGTASVEAHVQTHNKVKPDAVKMVTVVSTSTSIQLTWRSPVPRYLHEYSLIYNVQVFSSHYKTTTNVTTSNMTVTHTIEHLIPYTEYTINIRCIPCIDEEGKGFWSEVVSFRNMTEPDVPGAVPEVSPGGFRIIYEANSTVYFVDVFWQSIPAEAVHGSYIVTRTRVFDIHDTDDASCPRSSPVLEYTSRDAYSSRLKLNSSTTYAVCIDVYNEVGYNDSCQAKPMVIEPPSEESVFVDFYAEGSGNEITVKWNPLDDAVSYTIYWCAGSAMYLCQREQELQWILFPNTTFSKKLSFPAHVTYQNQIVAMSAEYISSRGRLISTGMHVADCIFSADKDPLLPGHIEVPANQYLPNSLIVKWRKPTCDRTGYINHFLLVYCKQGQCKQTETAVVIPVERSLNGDLQEYVIRGLEPDVKYLVKLASVGDMKTSPFCKIMEGYVQKQGLTKLHKSLVGLASFIFILLLVIGVTLSSLSMYKKYKKKINIAMPDTGPEEEPHGLRSETPDYNTTEDGLCQANEHVLSASPESTSDEAETESLLRNDNGQSSHPSLPDNSIDHFSKVALKVPSDAYTDQQAMQSLYRIPYDEPVNEVLSKHETSTGSNIMLYSQALNSSTASGAKGKNAFGSRIKSHEIASLNSSSNGFVVKPTECCVNVDEPKRDQDLEVSTTNQSEPSKQTAKSEGVIHWNSNVGKVTILKAKDFGDSRSSGQCTNNHWYPGQDMLSPGSSNSDSYTAISSGVSSDCSSGASPESFMSSSLNGDYLMNDTEQDPSRHSGLGSSEAANDSQVMEKMQTAQEALPLPTEDKCQTNGYMLYRAATNSRTLPARASQSAYVSNPVELLPLGGVGKQWQRDSGISTDSTGCSSQGHLGVYSTSSSPCVDQNLHLVK